MQNQAVTVQNQAVTVQNQPVSGQDQPGTEHIRRFSRATAERLSVPVWRSPIRRRGQQLQLSFEYLWLFAPTGPSLEFSRP